MKRQILIRTSERAGIITHLSEATTLGELRNELDVNLNPTEKKVMIRHNRNTLEMDEAKLPAGEFTLYVNPRKTKAGQDFEDLGFHELRAQCKAVGLPATGVSSVDMRAALTNYYNNTSANSYNVVEKLVAIKDSIDEVISEIGLRTTGVSPELLEEIERDFNEVRNSL